MNYRNLNKNPIAKKIPSHRYSEIQSHGNQSEASGLTCISSMRSLITSKKLCEYLHFPSGRLHVFQVARLHIGGMCTNLFSDFFSLCIGESSLHVPYENLVCESENSTKQDSYSQKVRADVVSASAIPLADLPASAVEVFGAEPLDGLHDLLVSAVRRPSTAPCLILCLRRIG